MRRTVHAPALLIQLAVDRVRERKREMHGLKSMHVRGNNAADLAPPVMLSFTTCKMHLGPSMHGRVESVKIALTSSDLRVYCANVAEKEKKAVLE